MKEFIKKNITLVLAFALPIILIAVVALVAYVPSMFFNSNYNFIYATCGNENYYSYKCDSYLQKLYSVVNGKLTVNQVALNIDLDHDGEIDFDKNYSTHIFFHDVKKNVSREITLQEAQKFSLNGLITDPDGVNVSGQYDGGTDVFPFYNGHSSYNYYLEKNKSKKRLNLINSNERYSYYERNFYFIGWVVN